MSQKLYSKPGVYGTSDVVTSVEDAEKEPASAKAALALMVPVAVALGAILLASYFHARTAGADSIDLVVAKLHTHEVGATRPKSLLYVPTVETHSGIFTGTGDGSAGSWSKP